MAASNALIAPLPGHCDAPQETLLRRFEDGHGSPHSRQATDRAFEQAVLLWIYRDVEHPREQERLIFVWPRRRRRVALLVA
jgi:hypothetical protein